MSIVIDEEFKSLIPPLSPEEYKQLEENCVKEGIRDALVVWELRDETDSLILLDGHNRWNISSEHAGIPFNIKRMYFESREQAKAWIINNQLGRRNLNSYQRSVLALQLKPLIAEQAKERQIRKPQNSVPQISAEQKSETRPVLADIAGVSHDTIRKVEKLEATAPQELKEQLRNGDISINQAFKEVSGTGKSKAQREKEQLETIKERVKETEQKIAESPITDFQTLKQQKEDKEFLQNSEDYDTWKEFTHLMDGLERFVNKGSEKMRSAFEMAGMWGLREPNNTRSFSIKYRLERLTKLANAIRNELMEVIANE